MDVSVRHATGVHPIYPWQPSWYMEVTNRDWAVLSVAILPYAADDLMMALLGLDVPEETIGRALVEVADVRHYTLRRDREFGAALVARLGEWWARHVVEGVPPEPNEADLRPLSEYYGMPRTPLRDATDEEEGVLARWLDARDAEKEADKAKKAAAARLKAAIGESEGLRAACGWATWKATKRGRMLRGEWTR